MQAKNGLSTYEHKAYFKTDVNNRNIFRNSDLTLSWKALHAAIEDNQNSLGLMKSSKWIPKSKQWLTKLKAFSIKIQLKLMNVLTYPKIPSQ